MVPGHSDSLPATGQPFEPIAKKSRSLLDSAPAIGYAANFLSLRSICGDVANRARPLAQLRNPAI